MITFIPSYDTYAGTYYVNDSELGVIKGNLTFKTWRNFIVDSVEIIVDAYKTHDDIVANIVQFSMHCIKNYSFVYEQEIQHHVPEAFREDVDTLMMLQ